MSEDGSRNTYTYETHDDDTSTATRDEPPVKSDDEPTLLWCLQVLQHGEEAFADDPSDAEECDAIYQAASIGIAKAGYSEEAWVRSGQLVNVVDDDSDSSLSELGLG